MTPQGKGSMGPIGGRDLTLVLRLPSLQSDSSEAAILVMYEKASTIDRFSQSPYGRARIVLL